MQIIPRPLKPDPQRWSNFRGVKKININDLAQIFPGYHPLHEVQLTTSGCQIPGQMTFAEMGILVSVVRALRAVSFAQIGTFDGITIRNILDNCPDLKSVVTVDLPDTLHASKGAGTAFPTDNFNASIVNVTDIGYRFRNHPRAGIVRDVRKDSATLTPADFPMPPEVFFVDGNHSYDYCSSDTRIALSVLARPGVMIWHDFGQIDDLPGVTRALTELADDKSYSLYWLKGFPETTLVFGIQNPV